MMNSTGSWRPSPDSFSIGDAFEMRARVLRRAYEVEEFGDPPVTEADFARVTLFAMDIKVCAEDPEEQADAMAEAIETAFFARFGRPDNVEMDHFDTHIDNLVAKFRYGRSSEVAPGA